MSRSAKRVEEWRPRRASDFLGVGCLLQLVVLALVAGAVVAVPELLPVWLVVLVLGLLVAGRLGYVWRCPACWARLPDRRARVCTACGAGEGTRMEW